MRVNKYLKLFLIVFLSACHLSRTMNPVAIYQAEESLPQKTIQDKPVFVTIQQERTTNMRCAQLWTEMVRETQVSLQDQNSNSTDYTSNGTQDYKKTKNVTSEWNSAKCSYVDTDSQAGRLNNVLVSYLETYMSFEDRIAVLSSNSSKSQYKIRVIVSSIVPDIEAKEQA